MFSTLSEGDIDVEYYGGYYGGYYGYYYGFGNDNYYSPYHPYYYNDYSPPPPPQYDDDLVSEQGYLVYQYYSGDDCTGDLTYATGLQAGACIYSTGSSYAYKYSMSGESMLLLSL